MLYIPGTDGTALSQLARDAVGGDPRALARLLDELEPLVVRTARLIVGPGTTQAEDAAQEALIDLARAITKLREPDAVVAWTARIATRRALRAARGQRLRWRRERDLLPTFAADQSDERNAALGAAFDGLPPRRRAIAVLRLYVGLSEIETARLLGISTGAVKSQLHAARRELAQAIFVDARTLIEGGGPEPHVAPGDEIRAQVLVCRHRNDPHFLKLVATRLFLGDARHG
jgi:RNA polymerase sigma factor (sigma-70 family)